jgi:tRNA G18 (ribose-2'-O)-methylase SpoU
MFDLQTLIFTIIYALLILFSIMTIPKKKPLKQSPPNVKSQYQHLPASDIKILQKEFAHQGRLVLFNLRDFRNISTIIRSAFIECFNEIDIIGRKHFDKRGCTGTHHYIPINYHRATSGTHNEKLDVQTTIPILHKIAETHQLIFIEQHETSFPLSELGNVCGRFEKPPAFVLGQEDSGLDPRIIEEFMGKAVICEIPSFGLGRSHNVSMAAGMVMITYHMWLRANTT